MQERKYLHIVETKVFTSRMEVNSVTSSCKCNMLIIRI